MNNQKKIKSKRELWFYVALGICVVAIILSATLYFSIKDGKKIPSVDIDATLPDVPTDIETPPTEPEKPTVSQILFIMPVNGTIIKSYSDVPVFNSTLNRYSSHMALDISAPAGSLVYAVYSGEVISVTTSITKGVTVTIDHGNGLKTVYNSLADGDLVTVGQTVKQGDVIGQVSVTNRQEYKSGAHVHFEVIEDGQTIDPIKYLSFDEK